MKAIFFIACVLIATSFATKISMQRPLAPKMPQMILAEIAAKITSGGPLKEIFQLIDTVEADVQREQAEHDTLWAQQQVQCDDEEAFRSHEIADAQDAYNRAEAHGDQCEASGNKADADLEVNLVSQTNNQQRTAAIQQARIDQHDAFLGKVQDGRDALDAIDTALEIVDELTSGSTEFIQLAKVSAKLFNHAVRMGRTQHFAGAIAALAQVAANQDLFGNEAAIARVVELLQRLRENVEQYLEETEQTENDQVEEFNEISANQASELSDLKEAEESLRDHIQEMDLCVTIETSIETQAQAKLSRNQQLLDSSDALCETLESEYESASASRTEILGGISELRDIVNRRLGVGVGASVVAADEAEFAYA